ncbi:hypothetical protein, partial [Vibrio navarrensis]|uniref:hypothetical protein n=1 Tax=Vibrio navarrensis TaxID=29495 RepID=UPI001D04BB22
MNISYRFKLICEEIAELNELTSKGKHNARKLKRAHNATRLRASGMFIRISSWLLQYRSGIGFSVSFFGQNKPFPAIP